MLEEKTKKETAALGPKGTSRVQFPFLRMNELMALLTLLHLLCGPPARWCAVRPSVCLFNVLVHDLFHSVQSWQRTVTRRYFRKGKRTFIFVMSKCDSLHMFAFAVEEDVVWWDVHCKPLVLLLFRPPRYFEATLVVRGIKRFYFSLSSRHC